MGTYKENLVYYNKKLNDEINKETDAYIKKLKLLGIEVEGVELRFNIIHSFSLKLSENDLKYKTQFYNK